MKSNSLIFLYSVLPVFVNCSSAPSLPPGRIIQYACVVDNPSHVVVGDVITQSTNHTSATCIEGCDADLFLYAGVEYGDECHRGIGLVPVGPPTQAPPSECNAPCSGDPHLSCVGSFRMQVCTFTTRTSSDKGRHLHSSRHGDLLVFWATPVRSLTTTPVGSMDASVP